MSEEARELLRAVRKERQPTFDDSKLTEDEQEALLKEWELCQQNAISLSNWAWQIGSVFVILSLAALWASTQLEEAKRWEYSLLLCLFSIGTISVWYALVVRRGEHLRKICFGRAWEIEEKLKGKLKLEKKQLPIHTRIKEKDKIYKTRAIYAVYCLLFLTVASWFGILILVPPPSWLLQTMSNPIYPITLVVLGYSLFIITVVATSRRGKEREK